MEKNTEKKTKVSAPRYQQIAIDIASKIVEKHYKIGEKIYARSYIASQYGVSSETARRALCILSDLNIVEITKGSGVIIKSYENALAFIHQYNNAQTVNELKHEMLESIERQSNEMEFFSSCLTKLIEKTERFRYTNPFSPFEIKITNVTPYLNQTIGEVNFWQNTFATITAIKRNDTLVLSPGPYAVFLEHDIFYFIGDENSLERVKNYIYPKN
ncbi:MAG: TrkA C-terminal domain-containing protein [Velocimicrobium sp.]